MLQFFLHKEVEHVKHNIQLIVMERVTAHTVSMVALTR